MTHEYRRLIEWSATHDYEYSKNDCMVFPLKWHDQRFGTDKASGIAGKYTNDYTAKKFYLNYIQPTTWLKSNGYHHHDDDLQDHDVLVVEHGEWHVIWIYFEGHLYFRDHNRMYKVKPDLITASSKWRR